MGHHDPSQQDVVHGILVKVQIVKQLTREGAREVDPVKSITGAEQGAGHSISSMK